MKINDLLSTDAYALRPVRIVKDEPVHYEAFTFPGGPRAGCELMLRRADVTGQLGHPGDPLIDTWIDVLDEYGDILQEWPAGPRAFKYVRTKLNARREPCSA